MTKKLKKRWVCDKCGYSSLEETDVCYFKCKNPKFDIYIGSRAKWFNEKGEEPLLMEGR